MEKSSGRGVGLGDAMTRRAFIAGVSAVTALGAGSVSGFVGEDSGSASEPISTEMPTSGVMGAEDYKGVWNFEVAPDPIPDDKVAESHTFDVVVVGGGVAGFVTAVSAAEAGATVGLVTASSKPISRGGSNFATYSTCMEKYGIDRCDPGQIRKEIAMNYNSVDQKKWYEIYNNSEEAMNWLIDLMENHGCDVALECDANIDHDDIYAVNMGSHGFINDEINQVGMGQSLVVNALADELVKNSGEIYYSIVGKQLIRETADEGGRVTALLAKNSDGKYIKFEASKAVVLATGDFSADRDMMYRFSPWAAPLISDEVYDAEPDYDKEFFYGGLFKGDGQKMGLWVGAAWQKTIPNAPNVVMAVCGPVQNAYQNYFGLLLDRDGERFSNEYSSVTLGFLTNWMQAGKRCYAIWSSDYIDAITDGWYGPYAGYQIAPELTRDEVIAGWDAKVESGEYVKFDTVEEVVDALGLPRETAIASIDRYNSMCETGLDTDFYKRADMLFPVKNGPFYGQASVGPIFLTVTGGLRTNANMQVCDADDNPIPGLYNVGTMVGDFYAGMYTFQIPGLNYGGVCLTLSYMAGRYIAQNE